MLCYELLLAFDQTAEQKFKEITYPWFFNGGISAQVERTIESVHSYTFRRALACGLGLYSLRYRISSQQASSRATICAVAMAAMEQQNMMKLTVKQVRDSGTYHRQLADTYTCIRLPFPAIRRQHE